MIKRGCTAAVGAIALACAASSASALQANGQPTSSAPAEAAQAPAAPAAATPTAPAASAALKHLPAGTAVVIEVTEAVSSDARKSGEPFGLRLAEPVVVDGAVVLPAGLKGAGEVVDAQHGGFGGAAGKLVLAARYLTYEDRKIPLRAFKFLASGQSSGHSNVGASMAVTLVSPLAGFAIHGGEMVVQPGARATAKIGEDLDLPALAQTPAPAQPTPGPSASAPAAPTAAPAAAAPAAAPAAPATSTNQGTPQ